MIKKVWALYFSPTGNTRRVVEFIAGKLSQVLNADFEVIDYSKRDMRDSTYIFDEKDLVIWGSPIYAGRLPNLLTPFIRDHIRGRKTRLVSLVTYGNRSFGGGLYELTEIGLENGFIPVGAGAFVTSHPFLESKGKRPDDQDKRSMDAFAETLLSRLSLGGRLELDCLPGKDLSRIYYQPLGLTGEPVNFLKARPKVNDHCMNCGLCKDLCPMGTLDPVAVEKEKGPCIKCHGCIHICPSQARYFDDVHFLSHVAYLDKTLIKRQLSSYY